MKKIIVIGIILAFSVILLMGCNKSSTEMKKTDKHSNNPLIGTWQYYEDIPDLPYKKSWTLKFTSDGEYTTLGDEIWESGAYSLSDDKRVLYMTKNSNRNTTERQIEIREVDGVTELVFLKDDRSEILTTSISQEKTYYTIFEKVD